MTPDLTWPPAHLRFYEDLTPAAKPRARDGVLDYERACLAAQVRAAKAACTTESIQARVNDPRHIRKLVERLAWLRRLHTDLRSCERSLIENRALFTLEGEYRPQVV